MALKRTSLRDRINAMSDTDIFADREVIEVPEYGNDAIMVKTGMTNASPLQCDIFTHLDTQISNYQSGKPTISMAVSAVAGSGKTSTVVAAANLIPRSLNAMFLAFNKSISDELKIRLPNHVAAKTLNGLGMGLLRPYLKGLGIENVNLSNYRTQSIIRKELNFEQQDQYGKDVKLLVNMCKSMGIIPVGATDGVGVNGLSATDQSLTQICVHHGWMIDPVIRLTVYQKVRDVLAISFSDSNIYNTNTIDFDDQKWLTVCKRPNGNSLARPTQDIVFIDEVQDVNAVDLELIKMVLRPNGIVCGVGDKNQSLYGFRGSDTNAFEKFSTLFEVKQLPLSITYRCSKALVRHAQELVPMIEWADTAVEGKVARLTEWDAHIFKPHDLVLCRNNAPLIEFAYNLISRQVPVFVKGRNIGDGLIRIITDCAAEKQWVPNPKKPGKKMPKMSCDGVRLIVLLRTLDKWENDQVAMIYQDDPDNEAAMQRVKDQAKSIRVFITANTDGKVTSVIEDIESLFSDDNIENAVVCSTIHKAKGLEAERAFLYDPSSLYPPYVKPNTWQYDQEVNLDYVARTRGKSYYGYLLMKNDV